MNKKSRTQIGIALCRLNSDSAAALQILPAGRFRATDGRPKDCEGWIVSSPDKLLALAKSKVNDFVVDYEHQTLAAAQNGQPAPAAGWFAGLTLEWRDDGLYAVDVMWTDRAIAYLKADEYRYASGVFRYNPKTGEVLELLSVALTNTPALDGMQAVVAAASQLINPQDTGMDLLTTLIQDLELPEGTTEDAVIEAVKQLNQAAADAAAAAKDKTTDKPVTPPAACKTAAEELNTELAKEVAALRAERDTEVRDRLIADNPTKLSTAGLKKWAKTQTAAALKEFLSDAPEISALTQSQTGGKSPDGKDTPVVAGMDAEQLAILKLTGVSPELVAQYSGVK